MCQTLKRQKWTKIIKLPIFRTKHCYCLMSYVYLLKNCIFDTLICCACPFQILFVCLFVVVVVVVVVFKNLSRSYKRRKGLKPDHYWYDVMPLWPSFLFVTSFNYDPLSIPCSIVMQLRLTIVVFSPEDVFSFPFNLIN
jgi:hypothetical protein